VARALGFLKDQSGPRTIVFLSKIDSFPQALSEASIGNSVGVLLSAKLLSFFLRYFFFLFFLPRGDIDAAILFACLFSPFRQSIALRSHVKAFSFRQAAGFFAVFRL